MVALQLYHAVRHHHLRAKFLRLMHRTRRQLLSGDAGGETEVVLDFGTGPGLPSGRFGLNHQRIQALRCRIDRRCQAGGPRADNNQVAQLSVVHAGVESQALRELPGRGIAQHGMRVADDDGNLLHLD